MKRSLLTLFENSPSAFELPFSNINTSRKKLKKALQIDIADPFTDKQTFLPFSTTSTHSRKFSFSASPKLTANNANKCSTTPRSEQRGLIEQSLHLFDNDTQYDDFYKEEEVFNLTMKKCHRRRMEDRIAFDTRVNTFGQPTYFFGIYDGHRNSYVSDFLQKNLHNVIHDFPEVHSQPKKAINEAINRIDKEVLKNQEAFNIQGGSTLLCAYVKANALFLANVGDSKAILIRNGKPVALNTEHRADNEEERKNIESRGGFIFEKKGLHASRYLVQGSLELTRSIGDLQYKEVITCEPDIVECTLGKDDEYVIMASDGFWNEISEEELVKLIKKFDKPHGLSDFLVSEVVKRRPYNIDNISLIAIDVQKLIKASC